VKVESGEQISFCRTRSHFQRGLTIELSGLPGRLTATGCVCKPPRPGAAPRQ
jgi:hypothetical protein